VSARPGQFVQRESCPCPGGHTHHTRPHRINLAFLDGYPENPALEYTLPIIFCRMAREGGDRTKMNDLADRTRQSTAL
jgi:hypothetical protein